MNKSPKNVEIKSSRRENWNKENIKEKYLNKKNINDILLK
jgi:hypothetical protein